MQVSTKDIHRGLLATRVIKSLAVGKGHALPAIAYAQGQNFGNEAQIVESLKAVVDASGTTDWGLATPASVDFAEFIRPLTIIGKLTNLRRVPARVRSITAVAGSTAYWAGEKNPRPIAKMDLAGETIEPLSIIAMNVATQELLRSSSPAAEGILSRDLAAAMVQAMDAAFIDPANAGIDAVKPASITNGVTAIHSSGTSLTDIDSDLALLVQALSDAGSDLTAATWVLRPRTALYLARLRGTGGALAYPQLTVRGGTLLGLPAVVSAASPSDAFSPTTGGEITLLDPSQILLVDDAGGAFDISQEATLDMSDAPGSPATQVSLWQTSSAVLKTTRYVNWRRCRDGMAQVLDQVEY